MESYNKTINDLMRLIRNHIIKQLMTFDEADKD
jgi:hypothetical protein